LHPLSLTVLQDDPRQRPTDPEPDWVQELQNGIRCQKILESANNDLKVGVRHSGS
jgi:hypothetical protein